MSFGKRKRDDDYDDFEKSIKYSETQDLSTAYKFIMKKRNTKIV